MSRLKDPVRGTVVSVGDDLADSLVSAGWVDADSFGDARPAGNASREEWEAYALDNGRTEEDVADLTRNDIRDLFA